MPTDRPEAEGQEPADDSTPLAPRGDEEDSAESPVDTGTGDQTDAQREAADFGGD